MPLLKEVKDKALDKNRFAALEHLLRQSEVYTKFLVEQMSEIEKKTDEEAAARSQAAAAEAEASQEEKGKGKKAGSKRGRASKDDSEDEAPASKQVKTGLTKTQVGLGGLTGGIGAPFQACRPPWNCSKP